MEVTGGNFGEDGIVELAQSWLLVAAVLLCLIQIIREKRRMTRNLLVLFALVFTSVLLREVDVEDFAWPRIFILLGSGPGRDILLGLCWLAYGWFALSRHRLWVPQMYHFLSRTSAGWAVMAGCICYASGLPFDKEWLPLGPGVNLMFEESLELAGCAFFLISAILLVRFGAPQLGAGGAWRGR